MAPGGVTQQLLQIMAVSTQKKGRAEARPQIKGWSDLRDLAAVKIGAGVDRSLFEHLDIFRRQIG